MHIDSHPKDGVVHHLNFLNIEKRMQQCVIDLHDAARMSIDPGISVQLRLIAGEVSEQVQRMRRLLISDIDSGWSEL